jgi:hypothetical protein
VSTLIIRHLYDDFPHITAVSRCFAVHLIVSADLPVRFARDQLSSLTDNFSSLIIRIFTDDSADLPAQLLALSIVLPSARFTPDITLPSISKTELLPDVMTMIQYHSEFERDQLIYASFIVQEANSWICLGGSQPPSFRVISAIQNLLSSGIMHRSAFCCGILSHAWQPHSVQYAYGLFMSFRCVSGVELLRQIVLSCSCKAYRQVIKLYGVLIFAILEQNSARCSPFIISLYSLLNPNLDTVLSSVRDKLLSQHEAIYRVWVQSLLLRLSSAPFGPLSVFAATETFTVIRHIRKIFEVTYLSPTRESAVSVNLSLNILSLLYETVNRFNLTMLSPDFVCSTISTLDRLAFRSLDSFSFLYFGRLELYAQIRATVVSHASCFRPIVEAGLSRGCVLGWALVGIFTRVNLTTVRWIVVSLLPTNSFELFLLLLDFCLCYVADADFARTFSDCYFDSVADISLVEAMRHAAANYALLASDLCSQSSEFRDRFMDTPAFHALSESGQHAISAFSQAASLEQVLIAELFVHFFEGVYRTAGNPQLPIGRLCISIGKLSPEATVSLRKLACYVLNQRVEFSERTPWIGVIAFRRRLGMETSGFARTILRQTSIGVVPTELTPPLDIPGNPAPGKLRYRLYMHHVVMYEPVPAVPVAVDEDEAALEEDDAE